MPIFDISVPISRSQTPTYPGDPGIEIEAFLSLSKGDPANVTMLHLGAHTGTHIDAPAHFIEGAGGVATLPLEVLVGEARVVEMSPNVVAITQEHLPLNELDGAERVLFKTRNSAFWENPRARFREDFTYLSEDAARALAERGVKLVGIDYLSIEKFNSEDFATHLALLSRGVVILEGLDLRAVSAGTYELICLPLNIAEGSGDGAPARAILRTYDRPDA